MNTSATPPNATAVRMVDIGQTMPALTDVTDYRSLRVYVNWNELPVGSVEITNLGQPVSAARLREAIVNNLALNLLQAVIMQHYPLKVEGENGRPLSAQLPADVSVSVVVATRDRPDDLRKCLNCLVAQVSPRRVEIVVVDNNPSSGLTRPVVVEFQGVVVVNEPRPGLSYARNKGFTVSTGEIVIATDDDVMMPPGWLEKLVANFIRDEVMVVTGNVLPLELETTAQRFFETYGGLGRGFQPRVFDRNWFNQFRTAVPTWDIGATANAAFRSTLFTHPEIGLIDEALGAGMPTGCSEDTYLFYKVLKAGYTIVYEPAAYVWHRHRRSMSALRRQIHNYSKGHVAYHLTTLIRDHDRRALVRLGVTLPQDYIKRILARLRGRSDYPLSLILLEIAGSLEGPWALWKSRRRVKREGRSQPYPPVSQCPAAAQALPSVGGKSVQKVDGRALWDQSISEEVAYWRQYIATEGMQWPDEYKMRLDPHSLLQENLIIDRLPSIPYDSISILDVGAGPLTVLGKGYPGKILNITAVDPLAVEYARILREANLIPPVPTMLCHGEQLPGKFEPESFDFAYARNSLDHSYDPLLIIKNILVVVKRDRFILLRHYRNEGEDANYQGLHQWNFEIRHNDFIIWNRATEHNVTQLLRQEAQVECYEDGGWIICILKKL